MVRILCADSLSSAAPLHESGFLILKHQVTAPAQFKSWGWKLIMYYTEQAPGSTLQGDIKTAKIFRVCHVIGFRKTPENVRVIHEDLTMDEATMLKNVLNAEESKRGIDELMPLSTRA